MNKKTTAIMFSLVLISTLFLGVIGTTVSSEADSAYTPVGSGNDIIINIDPMAEIPEIGETISMDGIECTIYEDGTARIDKFPSMYLIVNNTLEIPSVIKVGSPNDYTEYPVTVIGAGARVSGTIMKLIIPDSLIKIEDASPMGGAAEYLLWGYPGAFQYTNLNSIEIGNGSKLEYVGDGAFKGVSNVNDFTLPSTVRYIGTQAFSGFSSITIPDDNNIMVVKDGAFSSLTNIASFSLPKLQIIGGAAPVGNADVMWPVDDDGMPRFEKIKDVLYNKNKTVAIFYAGSSSTVELLEGTTTVSGKAFYGTFIGKIILPDSIEYIGKSAFMNCAYLRSVEFEETIKLKEIGELAFAMGWGTVVTSYIIKQIGWAEHKIMIPRSVEVIGENAFATLNGNGTPQNTHESEINSIEIVNNNNLKYIGAYAFCNIGPETIMLGDPSNRSAWLTIGNGAFSTYRITGAPTLKAVSFDPIKSNIVSIGDAAFSFGRLSGSTASNLEQFGNEKNTTIIPASVEKIGKSAFSGADYLGASTATLTTPQINKICFGSDSKIKEIGSYAFRNYTNCTAIDLSNCLELEVINVYAFALNSGTVTTNIILPSSSSDLEIGNAAFNRRVGAETDPIKIPASVASIGDYAFAIGYNYSSSVTATTSCFAFEGGSIISLGVFALGQSGTSWSNIILNEKDKVAYGTSTIRQSNGSVVTTVSTDITIGKDTLVLDGTFLLSPNIASITVDSANPYFFHEDGFLYLLKDGKKVLIKSIAADTVVEIPDDVDVIRGYAFFGCNDIKAAVIGGKNTFVEDFAFRNCLSLSSVLVSSSKIERYAFFGISGLAIFEPLDSQMENEISAFGKYGGKTYYGDDGAVLFIPAIKGQDVFITGSDYLNGVFTFELNIMGGYSQYDILVKSESGQIHEADMSGTYSVTVNEMMLLTITAKDRTVGEKVTVTVYANGGYFSDGSDVMMIHIPRGMSIIHSEIELPRMNKAAIDYWVSGSVDGPIFDLYDGQINGDLSLYSVWADVESQISLINRYGKIVVESAGSIIKDGDRYEGGVTISFMPDPGYELIRWKITPYGGSSSYYYSSVVNFAIENDTVIEAEVRLYAGPSIVHTLQTETPMGADLLRAWTVGGYVDTSNMSMWTGHSSVPVVVDNYVYIRVADGLYKAESDTGYIVKRVDSKSVAQFYHYVGYGNGQILDYATGKIYDLDLNLIYYMPSGMTSATYHDGYFYGPLKDPVSGQMLVVKFSADYQKGKIVQNNPESDWTLISSWYGQYGQVSAPIFADGYMYFLTYGGDNRYLVSVNINDSNDYQRIMLSGISKHYWGEGRLTYFDGVIYLTTYTGALFGGSASSDNSTIVSIPVDHGVIGDITYTRISLNVNGTIWDAKGFTSQFIIHEGKGYVNASDYVVVYDAESMTPLYYCEGVRSHGGMVISTYYDEGVYLYVVPYEGGGSTSKSDIQIYFDDGTQIYNKNTGFKATDYNSQAFRADSDGRLIYYNDGGWPMALTVPEKNSYYFFIEENGQAKWVIGHGKNAAEALANAGYATIIGSTISAVGLSGTPTSGWTVYALEQKARHNNSDFLPNEYVWKPLPGNNTTGSYATGQTYQMLHYYIITKSGLDSIMNSLWNYGDKGFYLFTDNIGDRSIIGTDMTLLTDVIYVDGISLDKDSLEINLGGSVSLTCTISPEDAYFKDVIWSSSDESVAYVDQNGNITAVNVGAAVITVTSVWDSSYEAECTVNVRPAPVALDITSLRLKEGGNYKLTAYIYPPDDDAVLEWVSSDTDIATVDAGGNVFAVGVGTAVITVTSVREPLYKAECTVNVYPASVVLDITSLYLKVGEGQKLTVYIYSSDDDFVVEWTSNNTSVAYVDSNGYVIAVTAGETVISAKIADGEFAICTVTVTAAEGGGTADVLHVSQSLMTMAVGDAASLTTYLSSGSMTGKTVRWASSNASIAAVSSGGNVTAIGGGVAVITASLIAANGDVLSTAVCVVTVEAGTGGVSSGGDPPVKTEVVNGVNGQMSSTTVKASVIGGDARVSQDYVEAIIQQIGDAKQLSKNSLLPALVTVDMGSARTLSIPLPSSIANAGAGLKVVSNNGNMEIPNAVLKNMVSGKTGDLTVSINTVDRNELMKDHRDILGLNDTVFEITIYVGSSAVHQLGGDAAVSIPYVIPSGASINNLHFWHLNDNGTIEDVNFVYKNGCIVFSVDHLSYFAAGPSGSLGSADGYFGIGTDSTTIIILMAIAIFALAIGLVYMIGRSSAGKSKN